MKASVFILLMISTIVLTVANAHADCDCRQPAYKDQMDYVTRYLACLDDCLNAQMQQIGREIETADQRISDLETEIDRLNRKIKKLENERKAGVKEK